MAASKKLEAVITKILLKDIKSPEFRARHQFEKEELEELAVSIKDNGLINPITVKKNGRKYEIVAGERRFLAHKKLGRKEIECIIREGASDKMEVMKFDENLKRVDLTDIEESQSLIRLKELLKCTEVALAKRIGKSVSYVKQKLLIMSYPQKLLNALSEQLITFSAARELVKITDENVLNEYVGHAVRSGITPSIAKQWADDWLQSKRPVKIEEEEIRDENGSVHFEEVSMPCNFCNKPVKASESRMIRACVSCLNELGK